MNISDCCGTPPTSELSEDLGLCSTCQEHCEFVCDHDWKIIDDSFDHAFGTRHFPLYERCSICDAVQDHEPYAPDYHDDLD